MRHLAMIAGIIHLLFVGLFYLLGSPHMAWLNFGSALLFGLSLYFLRERRNLLGSVLIVTEVVLHAGVAVRAIGWDSGFHYYLLVMAPVIFISRARQTTTRVLLLIGLMATYVALDAYTRRTTPLDVLPPLTLEAMRHLNLCTTLLLLAYLSGKYYRLVVQTERQLVTLASTDPLTHLHNRRNMAELAQYEIVQRKRHGEPLSLVLADVDHFKQINDTHGHEMGDRVLTAISEVLRDGIREQDSVARWGGEEFLILMPQASLESARMVAERLREQVSRLTVSHAGQTVQVTMTFGVACHRLDDRLEQLIHRADMALYQGKERGRDQVVTGAP
jgi:diguanylate cyclase (GGDEF)-like protein